jgi:hypothetical protein
MANNLSTPILQDGIRSSNFFNGRLLTAEDLSQEQLANREARNRLGETIGDGIVYGLEVTRSNAHSAGPPVLKVSAGLAVNRKGQTIKLPNTTDITLEYNEESPDVDPGVFSNCVTPKAGVYVAGEGVYLLLISPVSAKQGRAPASGLGNTVASCNAKNNVEGVQFRLIQVQVSAEDLEKLPQLRNRLAYKCFGVDDPAFKAFIANPFESLEKKYGLLDGISPSTFTECDVPLAIVYWTAAGIQFIDHWSVRRRLAVFKSDAPWSRLSGTRRGREAEAIFLQFQEQVEQMRVEVDHPESLRATDCFRYLPPIGLLPLRRAGVSPRLGFPRVVPLGGVPALNLLDVWRGFSLEKFFEGLACRKPLFIEGAALEPLIRTAMMYLPVDLGSREMLWLFDVRENHNSGRKVTAPYVVFMRGIVPFQATTRFDVSHYDYSNYNPVSALTGLFGQGG